MMRLFSQANVWFYRKTGGRIGGKWRVGSAFPHGVPVLLLTTIGQKSGAARTTPLLYLEDGERVILIASQGGMPKHPLWYLNLSKNPEVQVQIGREIRTLRARDATPEERRVYWPRAVAHYRDFASYQSWTDRLIPVVVLEPRRD